MTASGIRTRIATIARAALVACAALCCAAGPCCAATARVGNVAMGTVLQITVDHDDAQRARELAEESFEIAKHWEDVLTTWRADGELARLNARAGEEPVAVSRDLHAALATMKKLSAETGGAFDPAVGPLVRALRDGDSAGENAPVASETTRIESALELTEGHARLLRGASLDAGGIGKGIALDAVDAFLENSDARAWYLDFGGSSQVGRRAADGAPWLVAVAGLETGSLRGTVDLARGSLSTSRALPAGDAAGSIVDPRNGRPVDPPVLATVWADTATRAEVWSTALVVLGIEGISAAAKAGAEAMVETAQAKRSTAGFPLVSTKGRTQAVPSPDAK